MNNKIKYITEILDTQKLALLANLMWGHINLWLQKFWKQKHMIIKLICGL